MREIPVQSYITSAATRRKRRATAGYATMVTMLIMMIAILTAMSLVGLSLVEVRLATRSQSRAQALTAAESGVDDSLDSLRSNISNTSWSGLYSSSSPRVLYEDFASTKKFGSYYTTCVSINSNTQRKITSYGTSADGTRTVTLYAIVTIPQVPLGDAAIKSDSTVTISGSASINTNPTNQHTANIQSNNNIDLGGNGWDDGTLIATGTINGQGYYPSVPSAPAQTFPDAATTEGWRQGWVTTAQSGTIINNFNSILSSLTVDSGGYKNITAPAYINGNLSLSSHDKLRFVSTSTDPTRNIVYVNGDVSLGSQSVLESGVTLVIYGSLSMTGQSQYQITSRNISGATPTVVVYNHNGASNAIDLRGGSSAGEQGILYSVSGPVQVNGNAQFTGSIVSSSTTGIVSVTGNFTMTYPTDMQSIVKFPGQPYISFVAEN